MKLGRAFLLILALSLSVFVVFSGCSKKKEGTRVPNKSPRVKVSGGPPQGGTASYSVPIYWFGWDQDGVVDHFVYAIDDTSEWTETNFFQGSFLFEADSLREGEEFGKWHTFWIKAIDNLGAESVPDFLTFDARTVAPKSTIISPRCDPEGDLICQGPRGVGLSVKIIWEGEDPDSRDPRLTPAGYMWRLFNTTTYCKCDFGLEIPGLLDLPDYVPDSTSFWSEPITDTEIQFSNLQPGAFWLFGIRAIDEAGAIEPELRMNYNVTYFRTMPGWGSPVLRVYESASQHTYPNDGQVWEKQAPVGKQICFRWEGDATTYGGTISGYTYGYDIEDLNDPDQWEIGWAAEVKSACFTFEDPGFHYIYIKVKDYADAEQLAIVELELIEFLFDRDVLLVDDFFDTLPRDIDHDATMQVVLNRVLAYADTFYVLNTFKAGPGGVPRELKSVEEPALSELSRYKFIVWDADASQNQFQTGIRSAIDNGIVDVYLNGGGRLWIFGREIVRGTSGHPEDFSYPTEPDPESFPYRYLKITGEINRPVITPLTYGDGFRAALPNKMLSDRLPNLFIDYSKGGTSSSYGMSKVEAVTTAMQNPDLDQRPDTLYFYDANYSTSNYHLKACAFQFHDVYAGSKLVYMGFPIHMFYEGDPPQLDSLGIYIVDWMFEDMAASPTGRVTQR